MRHIPTDLRQLAAWVDEANDDNLPASKKISILDVDAGLLEEAADWIEKHATTN